MIKSSLVPLHSIIPKANGRLSSSLINGNLAKSRKLHHYHHKCLSHKESIAVAARYHPPWFSVAPMMDYTDNHFRTFTRLISKHAWLYTEMIAAETIVFQKGDLDTFLAFEPEQHPIVLQIGGGDLGNLAKATELANSYGYDEINLNCGCPSPKVAGKGCFGVRLMLDPKFVADAMSVISANTDVPVTVKCRIGVDDRDSYNELCDFIYKVSSQSPAKHFIIHSRKALLNGISPKKNRSIPPLKYEYYYALVRDFPDLRFTINGGINTIDEVNAARAEGAYGVMVGRAACNKYKTLCYCSYDSVNSINASDGDKSLITHMKDALYFIKNVNPNISCFLLSQTSLRNFPWNLLGHVDSAIYGAPPSSITRRQVLEKYQVYGDSVLGQYGFKPNVREVIKPLLNLFHSEPGNGLWKRKADAAFLHCKTIKSFFEETLVAIPDSVLDSPIAEIPLSFPETFANSKSLLPPPYVVREEELLCA